MDGCFSFDLTMWVWRPIESWGKERDGFDAAAAAAAVAAAAVAAAAAAASAKINCSHLPQVQATRALVCCSPKK